MPRIDGAGPVGFGCYRVSPKVREHGEALRLALDRGVRLIDTAPNYGGGLAEQLVGSVARSRDAFVVTKVGYVLQELADRLGPSADQLPRLDDATAYGIAPDVIRASIGLSRERLGVSRLDAVCLHNPEHLCEVGVATREEDLRDPIGEAFACLEAEVAAGRIGCYGVSSSQLTAAGADEQVARVRSLVGLAEAAGGPGHHFRILQFPWNLVDQPPGRGSVFDAAEAAGLTTVAHRPLNVSWEGRQLRLVDGAAVAFDPAAARSTLARTIECVDRRLDECDVEQAALDFPVMRFLRDQALELEHPELVDLVFERRVRPFASRLYDGASPGDPGPATFAQLRSHALAAASQRLGASGVSLRRQLVDAGRVGEADPRSLAVIAVAHALEAGADHVLVGMRRPEYVRELEALNA